MRDRQCVLADDRRHNGCTHVSLSAHLLRRAKDKFIRLGKRDGERGLRRIPACLQSIEIAAYKSL
jgi:hypothetical protein